MAEGQANKVGSLVAQLFHVGLYKRTQGRVVRQVTFAAMAVLVAMGAWQLSTMAAPDDPTFRFAIPGLIIFAGLWIGYRIVNYPQFADFLIAVEAEMNKVSWPSRTELFRSSLVVMFTIFFLALVLFFYDFMWRKLLELLNVLN